MNQAIIRHLLNHWLSRTQILLFTLAVIACTVIYFICGKPFLEQWTKWIDMVVTIATLFVAVSVWIHEKYVDWMDTLPKKLNIKYHLNNKEYAVVENAPLTGIDDIRQWGTSIAGTILNDKTPISFSGFKMDKPKREGEKMNYYLTIYLREPISGIAQGQKFVFNDEGNLVNN